MKEIAIYQATIECPWKFRSFEENHGEKTFKGWYQEKYRGKVEDKATLEDIYMKFNADDRPNRKNMHSLSISDIVETGGKKYYVDTIGFKEIKVRGNQIKGVKEKSEQLGR